VRLLIDTNVILDVLLAREPHLRDSAAVMSRVESGDVAGWLCATTVTTIFYLVAKAGSTDTAMTEVRKLLALFEIAPVNRPVLETAIALGFADFEDAVLHEAARQVDAKAIVSRNTSYFKNAELPVYTPAELLEILDLQSGDR